MVRDDSISHLRSARLEAVRLAKAGQEASVTARVLGMPKATLSNCVRATENGLLQGAGDKPVSAEQMGLVRVKMERDILKMRRRTLQRKLCEVRLDCQPQGAVARHAELRGAGVSASGYFEHQRRRRQSRPSQRGGGRVGNEALLTHIRAIQADSKGEYLAPGLKGTVGPGRACRQRPGAAPHAGARHPGTRQAQVVVLDLFSRQVVGWSMQSHMQASLVTDALRMAWIRRQPEPGSIFHSDRGSLKVGRLYGKRFTTQQQAKDEVIGWLTFYNHRRLHSTLGHVSPMKFEENWRAGQAQKAA